MNPTAKILLVDDDEGLLRMMQRMLTGWGHQVTSTPSPLEALQILGREKFDLLVSDIHMPDKDGFGLLKEALIYNPSLAVILMTGQGDVRGAVQAIQSGAADYITKPFPGNFLREMIRKVLRRRPIEPKETNQDWSPITQDPVMKKALQTAARAAETRTSVLIEGETGTGKEMVARYYHSHSSNAKGPFLAINCAAIPSGLIESELFGHERGAFTGADGKKIGKFEAAARGTLFLDEVGDLALDLQSKLLRVLDEKVFFRVGGTTSIDITAQIIGATNGNLKQMVKQGRFREDLYFRLNVVPILIPPLRERTGDIPLLIPHFLKLYEKEHDLHGLRIEKGAIETLSYHPWPGNIRELDHTLLRAAIAAPKGLIREEDLVLENESDPIQDPKIKSDQVSPLDDVEKEAILKALEANNGNRTHTAKALGISLSTLKNKLRKFSD